MKLLAILLFFVKLSVIHANLQPYAYLAINADARTYDNGTEIKRRLELNFLNCQNFDVVLYQDDPKGVPVQLETNGGQRGNVFGRMFPRYQQEILRINCNDYPDGFYITNIELPYLSPAELGYEETCAFDYYIQILNEFEAVTPRRCIKTNPSWMRDNVDTLGFVRFSDLLLTFTHDSGAFKYVFFHFLHFHSFYYE